MGIMEKKKEATIMGLYRVWDVGILGLYEDNGKENGNYYHGLYGDYTEVS